jgi:2-polyprenyl-3-methyl-5-hydroxy-6-metoxy-1,4-benzoquinol methylase
MKETAVSRAQIEIEGRLDGTSRTIVENEMRMNAVVNEDGIESIRSHARTTWMAGDYDHFSRFMENEARAFYERLRLPPDSKLLDVACGSGQLALVAARDGINATGIDIAETLIARARARAAAEQLSACFQVADAEELPFRDGSFDNVVSLIGAMFAPRPHRIASELVRVCAPDGTIAMANWTATGFIGQMFKIISRFITPANMPSPLLWGDEATVEERFGPEVIELHLLRRNHVFRYPFPPADVVDFFRLYYGPVNRAFASLDDSGRKAMYRELVSLWSAHNLARGSFTVVEAECLEVIATRA